MINKGSPLSGTLIRIPKANWNHLV